MSMLLDVTLEHLKALVGFDTRNPPRTIDTGGIFDYLQAQLPDFDCTLTDHGAGAVSLLAVRGNPRLLFNVHLDTVPDSPHWTASPFELRIGDDRATALGACDIKGAAAAMLAVAQAGAGDCAFLFSTDEEANDARCVPNFVRGKHDYEAVIVAEPTRCEAVLAHRGINSVRMRFAGRAGHASGEQQASDSALHQTVRWGSRALDYVEAQAHHRFGGMTGLRFNLGRIEGGIKANVIAPEADLKFGFRPLPSMDPDALLKSFHDLADPHPAEFEETFRGPSLPAGDIAAAESRRLAARDLADELGLPIGNAVDFWTEASLFSAAGYTTMVFGPGDIAQAHTADEWVALDQLASYADHLQRIIHEGHA
ncbi:acetylornithine deacetylase [Oleiagrimonas sp. MCCC 1A03011]|uniref:acetylornithine deacetylase n=1 Tax=Oleiagrimonas sp. MCCC 1A03011 TaxID=1926883 RepID=UPI000DC5BD85|nr:acetylornithine deacetylase [Oleiagrimonas sp. MCCC 1A03011]RAP56398.1 acetylornithine deacetylase [Oleiagrimonas sp. MCCC 1A03011]